MTNLHDIAQASFKALGLGERLMGLDLGTKTIGVATSDLTHTIATARETIIRLKFTGDAKRIMEIAADENIKLVVLGLPINMDGSEGARAQSTRSFARNLAKLTPVPIVFWDERLSTVAVNRVMLDANMSRKKRSENVDKLAAAYILQSFLDTVNG
jgi:putative holliday junction resolvase